MRTSCLRDEHQFHWVIELRFNPANILAVFRFWFHVLLNCKKKKKKLLWILIKSKLKLKGRACLRVHPHSMRVQNLKFTPRALDGNLNTEINDVQFLPDSSCETASPALPLSSHFQYSFRFQSPHSHLKFHPIFLACCCLSSTPFGLFLRAAALFLPTAPRANPLAPDSWIKALGQIGLSLNIRPQDSFNKPYGCPRDWLPNKHTERHTECAKC